MRARRVAFERPATFFRKSRIAKSFRILRERIRELLDERATRPSRMCEQLPFTSERE